MFTVLDMNKGYHQMPLDPSSQAYTAMATHIGLLQWRVMPMGAKNGNSAFQRMMEWVLAPFDFAWPFVDDVIIASDDTTEEDLVANHLNHVTQSSNASGSYNWCVTCPRHTCLSRRWSFVGTFWDMGAVVPPLAN